MIIDRKEIEGLKPVAEGYKVFNNDWTTCGNYCYVDENGNVEGVVHKQEGIIEVCDNGFHFCELPFNCLRFYPCRRWNKFAKVKGYGQISKNNNNTKVAVEILEIVKVLTFDEFVDEVEKYSQVVRNSSDVSENFGISYIWCK